jgi:hypothetical protein
MSQSVKEQPRYAGPMSGPQDRNWGCIPVIALGATTAAERQDARSQGCSAAEPLESCSCGRCRVDWRNRDATTRLLPVAARNRGFRCASPSAIRITPLRGGLSDDSHHPARCMARGNGNAPKGPQQETRSVRPTTGTWCPSQPYGQWAVGSGRWVVGGGRCAVGGG